MEENGDVEDVPTLSAETFAALQDFYKEQDLRDQERSEIKANGGKSGGIEDFQEDWQLSQFWYDEKTAQTLAKECFRASKKADGSKPKIACISCPTLYFALKKVHGDEVDATVFEYDKRFASIGADFEFYDYKSPLDIPRDLRESFDLVFADPPFLSEECLTKTAVTVKYLAKGKVILCSGAVMEELAGRLLNVKKCRFAPKHRNNLANEFQCFSNYNLDQYIFEQ